jgi:hypothetical protein
MSLGRSSWESVVRKGIGEFPQSIRSVLTGPHGWVPFMLVLVFYALQKSTRDDPLLLSGFALLIVGIILARHVPTRMHQMLRRLRDRGALEADDAAFENFKRDLDSRAEARARWAAWIGTGVMVLIWALAVNESLGSGSDSTEHLVEVVATLLRIATLAPLLVFEMLAGYAAGYQLGRMASFGFLAFALRRNSCALRVIPGHPDGAAGLKPIGDFYFFQAMIASLPAVYLAGWSVAFALSPRFRQDYSVWHIPYLAALPVAIAVELLAFFVPLWWFHEEMAEQKSEYLREADRLSMKISGLRPNELQETGNATTQPMQRLDQIRERYSAIEAIPTWPVDAPTRRRLGLRNLGLVFLPLIGQLLGGSDVWKQITDSFSQLTS